jgi:hypothetical protein
MLSFYLDGRRSHCGGRREDSPGRVEVSNRITVDGDTSTNDTCALLASGQAGGGRISGPESGLRIARGAITAVMDDRE